VPEGKPNRLIIGISGASGVIYGIRLLQILRNTPFETHLVISRAAEIALAHETSRKLAEVKAMADVHYAASDIGAAISSGSYRTNGMIVAPCSIRSMSEIASGVTSTLLTRAADGASPAGTDGAGNAAAYRSSPDHARSVRDGSDRRTPGTGILRRPAEHR
jgi:4-hydroxy-3-polyprenylbenzoate decarboxylase